MYRSSLLDPPSEYYEAREGPCIGQLMSDVDIHLSASCPAVQEDTGLTNSQ